MARNTKKTIKGRLKPFPKIEPIFYLTGITHFEKIA